MLESKEEVIEFESKNDENFSVLLKKFPKCVFHNLGDTIVVFGKDSFINNYVVHNEESWENDPSEKLWTNGLNNKLIQWAKENNMKWEHQRSGQYILN